MRKKMVTLAVMLSLAFVITAQAGLMRAPTTKLTLSFSGETATCTTIVQGESTDKISVTAKLWNGGTCLETWRDSGTGRVVIQETASVSKGNVYRLSVNATINGVAQGERNITKVCPE